MEVMTNSSLHKDIFARTVKSFNDKLRETCNVQGSDISLDAIKFDKVFIIATLHSIISLQWNQSVGQYFSILTKPRGKKKYLTMTNSESESLSVTSPPNFFYFPRKNAVWFTSSFLYLMPECWHLCNSLINILCSNLKIHQIMVPL